MRGTTTRWIALSVLVAAAATGCSTGGDSKDDNGDQKPVVIDVTITGDSVTPNGDRVEVHTGQQVELKVDADAPGEIHVHSDPEHEFAYPAGTKTFSFTIDRPGIVAVESHDLDKTIVQLQVQ